jgi:alpha-glucosidase (family GH31 glycosyl hydrolase)
MGKYGSKWLGDNYADIDHMQSSVTGTMMMNMFGIPLSGSDICGFGGDTTGDLCPGSILSLLKKPQ